MFKERMENGHTRLTLDISDYNLLRLRILQYCDEDARNLSLSEFVDQFLDTAIELFVSDLIEDNPETGTYSKLLGELLDSKSIWLDTDAEYCSELPKGAECSLSGKHPVSMKDACFIPTRYNIRKMRSEENSVKTE